MKVVSIKLSFTHTNNLQLSLNYAVFSVPPIFYSGFCVFPITLTCD